MTATFAQAYVRPDPAALEAEVRAHARAFAAAPTAADAVAEVRRWNQTRSRVQTSRYIALVRYEQDTRDPAARAENDFWNDASSLLRELDVIHARALLAGPHRDALARAFGPQLLALKECAAATFAPEIRDAIAEEARLYTRYTELMAETAISFRGETLNLSGIARWFVDGDRATRREAQQARDAFLAARAEELDALYDRLVRLRDGMGRALGLPDFIPLGYRLMERTGWGPAQAAAFRDEIRREVVPFLLARTAAQARRLGVPKVMFWDEPAADPAGNPRPLGGVDFCVAAARTMYRALGPEFSSFFEVLAEEGLMDLDNRSGKAGGGFCLSFPDLQVPFVFANFNGTDGDVKVMTHELGHAFQAWSSRTQPLVEYLFPTSEAAEVHSMGMEYLTYPWMHLFFGADEAARFRRVHLEQQLLNLPYMAAVDHFQERVYANPGLSPAQRGALWLEMERLYLPHRDYGDALPYLARGTVWQRQLHIYGMPFYYLDYALAQTCALQLWHRAEHDHAAAVADYLAICAPGGSLPFGELVARGRLRSPFEPGCLREVVVRASKVLE